MDRKDAIEYLMDKDKIKGNLSFSAKEEEEIKLAMKKGKIYGDPLVQLS